MPPCLALTIKSPLSSNRNILTVPGIDKWRVVITLYPLPAREDDGQIVSQARAKTYQGIAFQAHVDVAAQMNGSCYPRPRWYQDNAAASNVTSLDGPVEGLGIHSCPIIHGPKLSDVKDAIGEGRWFYWGHIKW